MELNLLKREDIPADSLTVSPSQMSQWYRCRYAWKLSKIDGVGNENFRESGAANKGLIFHAFMDWYYKRCLGRPVLRLTSVGHSKALEHVSAQYGHDPALYQVFAIWVAYIDHLVETEEGICLGSEVETFAPTGLVSRDGHPIYFHGFIDLIKDIWGKLIFSDHKSHTNRWWTKERLFYDHQFMFYWLLLELQGVTVDGAYVNSINLDIPKKSTNFDPNFAGGKMRFEQIPLSPHEVRLEFYLNEFLNNIKQMWCEAPVYPMRLSSDCQFCTFRAHIELDAKGLSQHSVETLKVRHNTEDFDLEDDLEEN